MSKNKPALHPIGRDIIHPPTMEELFVFGDYWNGKIDVRDRFGRERVMTLAEQKQWFSANEYKAIRSLQRWLKQSEALWRVLDGVGLDYEVTVICEQPATVQTVAA